eukprot:scaffold143273_cov84-Phaeocystis_antarctica.AAC.1
MTLQIAVKGVGMISRSQFPLIPATGSQPVASAHAKYGAGCPWQIRSHRASGARRHPRGRCACAPELKGKEYGLIPTTQSFQASATRRSRSQAHHGIALGLQNQVQRAR